MKDIESQVSFVVESVERILSQIDWDPLSPTYGCAHPAYWRDKTSDVADTRRQEVMLPLAMLFTRDYPGSAWKGNERLKTAISALLSFWNRIQYSDGSFDEWYKGERAYAAAAFSAHAVARTLNIIADHLTDDVACNAKIHLARAARWLAQRDDLFKTNHQAVGAASLAWAGFVLKDQIYTKIAKKKLASIATVQTSEKWFPEIGQMDIGYTFLTVEFAAMAMEIMKDWSHLEPFREAFDFACEWVHPDLTTGEEYGVCHNSYISRIAIILMSPYSGRAAFLRKNLEEKSAGYKGYKPFLADDLRLMRWSFQPLLAYDFAQKTPPSAIVQKIPLVDSSAGDCLYKDAGLGRVMVRGKPVIVASCAGGLARFLGDAHEVLSDFGYAIKNQRGFGTNFTYNRKTAVQREGEALVITGSMARVKKFMPSFRARVMLHLLSSTSVGSRLTRKFIDFVRCRKGTSINQASANLSASSHCTLQRNIHRQDQALIITDALRFDRFRRREDIFFLTAQGGEAIKLTPLEVFLPHLPSTLKNFEIIKVYTPFPEWKLKKISITT